MFIVTKAMSFMRKKIHKLDQIFISRRIKILTLVLMNFYLKFIFIDKVSL